MSQREIALRAREAVIAMCGEDDKAKLKTLCMKMPGLMCQSGLAQTIVFIRSRDRNDLKHGTFYLKQLIRVLGDKAPRPSGGRDAIETLQEKALSLGVVDYIALTAEVQRAMEWMRRFAQIEMQKIDQDEGNDT